MKSDLVNAQEQIEHLTESKQNNLTLGIVETEGLDLNTVLKSCFFHCVSPVNAPTDLETVYCMIFVFAAIENSHGMQFLVPVIDTSVTKIYFRMFYNQSMFSPWILL